MSKEAEFEVEYVEVWSLDRHKGDEIEVYGEAREDTKKSKRSVLSTVNNPDKVICELAGRGGHGSNFLEEPPEDE